MRQQTFCLICFVSLFGGGVWGAQASQASERAAYDVQVVADGQKSSVTTSQSGVPTASSTAPTSPRRTPSTAKHTFHGKVEKVDLGAGTLTVSGESVPGWMAKMTMIYHVDKSEIPEIKSGDQIIADVYEGDFSKLYRVRVAVNTATRSELPPLSYVCSRAGEESVISDKPGKCPLSGASLEPVRLVTVYSCLRFTSFVAERQGVCPIDKSELVPITAGLYFTCKDDANVHQMVPGTCADGTARIKAYDRRPHGDHNPRHGGQFFMADDNWHHLEGTFVPPNVFRVYFYNDFTQPLMAAGITAIAVRTDKDGKEIATPVAAKTGQANDRSTVEVKIPGTKLPASFELRVKFKPDDKERVFNFTFADYSKEPVVSSPGSETATSKSSPKPVVASADRGSVAQTPSASPGTLPPQDQSNSAAAFASGLAAFNDPSSYDRSTPIPSTLNEIMMELAARNQAVRGLIDQGAFSNIWVLAFQAKALGLAINDHATEISADKRKFLDPLMNQLVRSVWLLDAYGDLGNRDQINAAYADFASTISQIQSLVGTEP